jgi:L-amino acid N-acyltransferase YncA
VNSTRYPVMATRRRSNGALIRDCVDADMPAVQAIYSHHVRTGLASFEEEPPSLEELQRRRSEVLKRGLPYLVAEVEGVVQGYAYATPYRSRTAYRFTIESSVYVASEMARRGIGWALVARLIARCEVEPWRQMIALHRALGFHMVGTLRGVGFKHGRWVDTVLMQRELGSGSKVLPASPISAQAT